MLPSNLTTIVGYLFIYSHAVQSIQGGGLTEIKIPPSRNDGVLDGFLAIEDQTSLSNISFPKLNIAGGFSVLNVTGLKAIDGFPALSKVYGDVDLRGPFTKVALPNLTYVGGDFEVLSSDNSFRCPFPEFQNNGVVQAGNSFICGPANNPIRGLVGGNASHTSSGATPSASHTASGATSTASHTATSSATIKKYMGKSYQKIRADHNRNGILFGSACVYLDGHRIIIGLSKY